MNSSLDALVKNLSDNNFKHLSQEFSGEQFDLVKKEVYQYESMESFGKFSEEQLPDKSKFFSSLENECISKTEYLHANNVWNMFQMFKWIKCMIIMVFI